MSSCRRVFLSAKPPDIYPDGKQVIQDHVLLLLGVCCHYLVEEDVSKVLPLVRVKLADSLRKFLHLFCCHRFDGFMYIDCIASQCEGQRLYLAISAKVMIRSCAETCHIFSPVYLKGSTGIGVYL